MAQPDAPVAIGSVAKVFESTKIFRDRLAKLAPAFDEVDRLGKDAITVFELVVEVCDHLSRLANVYAPVAVFQMEVTKLAQGLEPFRGVQKQFADFSRSVHDQLNYLALSMEPATKLQERLVELAAAFEPALEMRARFEELARTFDSPSTPSVPTSTSNETSKRLREAVLQRALSG